MIESFMKIGPVKAVIYLALGGEIHFYPYAQRFISDFCEITYTRSERNAQEPSANFMKIDEEKSLHFLWM